MTSPNDWLHEPLMNFQVVVHHGVVVKPKWYDFPRHFGWRAKKRVAVLDLRGDQVVIDRRNHIIYCTPAMEAQLRRYIPDRNFISLSQPLSRTFEARP